MDDMKDHDNAKDGMPTDPSLAEKVPVSRLRTVRNISCAMALIMTVVFAGYAGWRTFGPNQPPPTAKQVGQTMIKSAFQLTDHQERRVTAKDFHGKWQLVFFGFTYCPDICPTTLSTVSQAMDILSGDADKVTPLFITVDPERDTPKVLAEYVKTFHPRLIGLTGTSEQIKSAAQAFRIYYAKAPQKDAPDGYLMGHSGFIYLMTPDGRYEAVFSHERDTPETIAAAIRKRLQET